MAGQCAPWICISQYLLTDINFLSVYSYLLQISIISLFWPHCKSHECL